MAIVTCLNGNEIIQTATCDGRNDLYIRDLALDLILPKRTRRVFINVYAKHQSIYDSEYEARRWAQEDAIATAVPVTVEY